MMFNSTGEVPEDIRKIAETTVRDIVSQKKTNLRMGLTFKRPQTAEAIKGFAKGRIAEDRLAALDNYPDKDDSFLPLLVDMIEHDGNLDVVVTAIRRFNAETKQNFEFPDYAAVIDYWNKNRPTVQQKPKP